MYWTGASGYGMTGGGEKRIKMFLKTRKIKKRHIQNAAEKPPFFIPSWTAMYAINIFVVGWVLVVGFRFGGWASMTNFVGQVDTFGLFAKCYQCKPPTPKNTESTRDCPDGSTPTH
ncbi:auxin transporter-like protein 4 [Actinidia eriantha]|uniref:auxin transporter-like protein 4 n=1 Tax=Actinidia eriantha TaxID=165200 RepID=UPI00258E7976|nr:auxin transporter-like protein 4 [Actinidia eriantha]